MELGNRIVFVLIVSLESFSLDKYSSRCRAGRGISYRIIGRKVEVRIG